LGGLLSFLISSTGWENATGAYAQSNNNVINRFKVEGTSRTEYIIKCQIELPVLNGTIQHSCIGELAPMESGRWFLRTM
jgi:hypothetical protein